MSGLIDIDIHIKAIIIMFLGNRSEHSGHARNSFFHTFTLLTEKDAKLNF